MQFKRHSVMLLCSDVPTSSAFYTRHLGLEVNADLGWFVGLQRKDPSLPPYEMALCAADHESLPSALRRPSEGVVLTYEIADADSECAQMRDAGVVILAAPVTEPWGQRHFFARAPDGVALDLFQMVAPDPEWLEANGFA